MFVYFENYLHFTLLRPFLNSFLYTDTSALLSVTVAYAKATDERFTLYKINRSLFILVFPFHSNQHFFPADTSTVVQLLKCLLKSDHEVYK